MFFYKVQNPLFGINQTTQPGVHRFLVSETDLHQTCANSGSLHCCRFKSQFLLIIILSFASFAFCVAALR